MMPEILYTDGGCAGNSQRNQSQRIMRVAVLHEYGAVLVDRTARGGSNNLAELLAIEAALAWCARAPIAAVQVRTDSQNAINWIRHGRVGTTVNDPAATRRILARIAEWRQMIRATFTWLPRARNLAGQYLEDTEPLND
jgi:ribonuclease HI